MWEIADLSKAHRVGFDEFMREYKETRECEQIAHGKIQQAEAKKRGGNMETEWQKDERRVCEMRDDQRFHRLCGQPWVQEVN